MNILTTRATRPPRRALGRLAPAVNELTCVPHWSGEDCDYGMAIDALLRREGFCA